MFIDSKKDAWGATPPRREPKPLIICNRSAVADNRLSLPCPCSCHLKSRAHSLSTMITSQKSLQTKMLAQDCFNSNN